MHFKWVGLQFWTKSFKFYENQVCGQFGNWIKVVSTISYLERCRSPTLPFISAFSKTWVHILCPRGKERDSFPQDQTQFQVVFKELSPVPLTRFLEWQGHTSMVCNISHTHGRYSTKVATVWPAIIRKFTVSSFGMWMVKSFFFLPRSQEVQPLSLPQVMDPPLIASTTSHKIMENTSSLKWVAFKIYSLNGNS